MATNKTGFSYYNTDTDRYLDIRIKRIKKDFGCSGIAVYDYILCEIYRVKGCFIVWDESTAFDVADYFGLKETLVKEIVNYCGVVGLFDKELLARGSVLTSQSIQKRYVDMCIRSKRNLIIIQEEYNILPEEYKIIQEEYNKKYEECDRVDKSKINKKKNKKENEFEEFRLAYPGNKRGLSTEFENFKKKHKDWKEVLPLLMPSIDNLKKWREKKIELKQFVPEYKNLQTWINQRCWEVELENIESNEQTYYVP